MSHLDEGTIHALLDGEISSVELPPIQAHLDRCEQCRARLAEEQELVDVSARLVSVIQLTGGKADGRTATLPHRRALVWTHPLAWAATVVLAAGLGYAMARTMAMRPDVAALREIDSSSPVATVVAQDAPASAAPVPAEPVPAPGRSASERRAVAEAKDLASPREKARAADSAAPPRADAEASRSRLEVAAGAAAPSAAAALPPATQSLGGVVAPKASANRFRLEEMTVTSPAVPIEFTEAVRRMGGTIRLVEGLVPLRLEQQGVAVRVVYRTGFGELVLSQELVDGKVRHNLIAPPGFPADSLERLRGRVRE